MSGLKRFYKETSVAGQGTAWQALLDGRAVKTPGKAALGLPTKALAEAIAAEWAAQGEEVLPDTMPLTQFSCSAIDRVAPAMGLIAAQVSAFAETDLIAYPTDKPKDLRAKQNALWDPALERLAALDWNIARTEGLLPIDQDPDLKARAHAWLESKEPFALTAIASLIEASGSFFLTYLHAEGHMDADTLVAACTIEDRFNLEKWGAEEEAEELLARREVDLRAAAQMLDLLQHTT